MDSFDFSIRFSKSDGKTVLLVSNIYRVANRDKILANIEAQDWGKLYPRMVLHASRRLAWIGLNAKDGAMGYDPGNIVSLAVEKLLTGKRLPTEEDFEDFPNYLKNVLNSLIYSLKCKKENKLKDPRDLDGPLRYSLKEFLKMTFWMRMNYHSFKQNSKTNCQRKTRTCFSFTRNSVKARSTFQLRKALTSQ
jgi:hypothetical protein